MPDYPSMHRAATTMDFGLTADQEAHARQLHSQMTVIDCLMECTWYDSVIDLWRQGGVTAGNMSIGVTDMHGWLAGDSFPVDLWWSWEALVNDLEQLPQLIARYPDALQICGTVAQIESADAEGRIGLVPGVQNAEFLGRDTSRLDEAYALGLRIVQLTYNRINGLGSGCMEHPENQFGLSRFGVEAVGALNDRGMLVDTGHCSSATLMAAVDVSEKPIACSHSGLRSMVDQPRSHTDDALKKLADHGGVFGVISAPGALNGTSQCTVHDYLDNIEHAVDVLGYDHVGIGTDFVLAASLEQILGGPDWNDAERESVGVATDVWPFTDGHEGMENGSGYPNLTRGLVSRGHSDDNIAKIMGGNWMRLFGETIG